MTNPNSPPASGTASGEQESRTPSVLAFNANDPSGAGGLSCDVVAIASVGAHALPVVTGAFARDTTGIFDFFPFNEESLSEQARVILEDAPVQVIKVGFAGSPENLSAIAELASDYADLPLIAYMPDLSWWDESRIELYQDAFRELLLPETTVLLGNHSTLWRWLLPDWSGRKNPTPRDIARAAAKLGVPYTLVTGIAMPGQFLDNVLASPETTMTTVSFERFDAVFSGAGDTLSAALAALIATGSDLVTATGEALHYLDRSLDAGFRPGMGNVVPDRLFWAGSDEDEDEDDDEQDNATPATNSDIFESPFNETRH